MSCSTVAVHGQRVLALLEPTAPIRGDLLVRQVVVLSQHDPLVRPVPVQLDAVQVAVAELSELSAQRRDAVEPGARRRAS